MNDYLQLKKFGPIPVSHQNLTSLLKGYKAPNDKIRDWVHKGYLIPLVRGMYTINAGITGSKPSSLIVANMQYGPSYVSLEYALSYYLAIPEMVMEISSVTTKRNKTIENTLGRFTYIHLPLPYFSYGIRSVKIESNQYALIATPEKALFDTIVCTRRLILRSRRDVLAWIEDMRIDESWLAELDLETMHQLVEFAPKRSSLQQLLKVLHVYAS